MRGTTPHQDYYTVSFTSSGIELQPASMGSRESEIIGPGLFLGQVVADPKSVARLGKEARIIFDYLVKSFNEDYRSNKLAIEQAGWRTRIAVSEATPITTGLLYGREGKLGPLLKELLSSGLVETRFFPGQRGRGGEVTKLRVAYEKEQVKRIVDDDVVRGATQ